jgi:hypothetical protein
MFSLGSLLRSLSPLLFQGFGIYQNWKDKRVIHDLQGKIKSLRILVAAMAGVLILMLAWMVRP